MKSILILTLGLLTASIAEAKSITISCKMSGVLAEGKWEYTEIVKGSLTFNPDELQIKKSENGCTPTGLKSQYFGEEGGTRLQISVWKCGDRPHYVTQQVFLNGVSVGTQLDEKGMGQLNFNEGPTSFNPKYVKSVDNHEFTPEPPMILPEGIFRFAYSNCKTED